MTTLLLVTSMGMAADDVSVVDFACSPGEVGTDGIVGLAPLEVQCVATLPAAGTWDDVTWTFGDGSVVSGESASFVYTEPGQYTVSVRLEGYDDGSGVLTAPTVTRYGLVTVCGEPEPAFTYQNKGGLVFDLINKTTVAVHCVNDLRWDVFRGGTGGDPAMTLDTWDPRVELPDEGEWTFRLTLGGMGGTAASELTIDAQYQLTDDFDTAGHAAACTTVPLGGPQPAGLAAFGALAVAAIGRARRRR
ncbi:MAG: PKD domain-containing protein [Myxococcota bacterium]